MAQVIFMSTPHNGSSYTVRDKVTIKASIDQSTLSSTYDKYTVRFYINGSRTSKVSVTSLWTASMDYTFTDDDIGTTTIYAVLCDSSGGELGPKSGTVSVTVEASLIGVIYYACVELYPNGGSYGGTTPASYTNSATSWDSYAYVTVEFEDPGFTKSGYTLIGFSESKSATTPDYQISSSVDIKATSEDPDNPTTLKLYAVWIKDIPAVWSWTSTIGGTLTMNSVGDNQYEIFPMTAKEWNNFIGYIRTWAQLQNISLSQDDYTNAAAVSNTTMKASQAQAVVNLLNDLDPPTKPPKAPYAGDSITAAFINGLATSLNSMRDLYE